MDGPTIAQFLGVHNSQDAIALFIKVLIAIVTGATTLQLRNIGNAAADVFVHFVHNPQVLTQTANLVKAAEVKFTDYEQSGDLKFSWVDEKLAAFAPWLSETQRETLIHSVLVDVNPVLDAFTHGIQPLEALHSFAPVVSTVPQVPTQVTELQPSVITSQAIPVVHDLPTNDTLQAVAHLGSV